MAIVFLDPVSPARLPSRRETLDFTVTVTDPESLVVSLQFPDGRMETIWQAGIVGRYYTVTRDGSENRTFHITREGGWPNGPFRLPMTETPIPATTAWDTLGDFDFTSYATTTPNTAQNDVTITLGGVLWNVASRNGGSPGQGNVNGSGFRLELSAGGWAGGTGQDGSQICLQLSRLTGYNSAKKQAILGVVNYPTMTGVIQRFAVGHWHSYNDRSNSGTQSIDSASQISAGLKYSGGNQYVNFNAQNITDGTVPSNNAFPVVTPSTAYTFGAVRYSDSYGHGVYAPYAGTMPRVEDVKVLGGAVAGYSGGDLYGGVGIGTNAVGQVLVYVKRLVFLQEK